MPFSHHSHSGQFCGHAQSTLEEVILRAIGNKMHTFCLTEHIPRDDVDFYPEEAQSGVDLYQLFDAYYREARRLQTKYAAQLCILVGFEGEWIRDSSLKIITDILAKYPADLFVGSVHHVHTIPIDFDTPMYHAARERSSTGDSDKSIAADYFDAQFEMLQALRPPLVGHFDLIRLKSDDPERSFRSWPEVWEKIERNLRFIAEYGGVLELNSSSLRKGMTEAYPQSEICSFFQSIGGRFTLSDDSHGVEQVGLNFAKIRQTLERAGIAKLFYLKPLSENESPADERFPLVRWQAVATHELLDHELFSLAS